jgi:hypothetical protein
MGRPFLHRLSTSERFGKFQFIERKSAIDMSQLRVVAYVQDETTKEILQAAVVDLPAPAK